MDFGALVLIPTLCVLVLAIWSHRTLESVIVGAIVAFLMMDTVDLNDAPDIIVTEETH